jgi:hypothetical protein
MHDVATSKTTAGGSRDSLSSGSSSFASALARAASLIWCQRVIMSALADESSNTFFVAGNTKWV